MSLFMIKQKKSKNKKRMNKWDSFVKEREDEEKKKSILISKFT